MTIRYRTGPCVPCVPCRGRAARLRCQNQANYRRKSHFLVAYMRASPTAAPDSSAHPIAWDSDVSSASGLVGGGLPVALLQAVTTALRATRVAPIALTVANSSWSRKGLALLAALGQRDRTRAVRAAPVRSGVVDTRREVDR